MAWLKMDWIAIAQLAGTIIGFFLVLRQMGLATGVRTLNTQTQLVTHSFSVLSHINATPSAHQFAFGGKTLTPTSSAEERATADVTAQIYLDLFEHVCLQAPTLDKETRGAWEAWVRDVFSGSPMIQTSYKDRHRWYSSALKQILDPLVTTVPRAQAPPD